ncbi:hypothetical protein TNCV_4820571 [Trichonephila clavipes]|nr:hypothetical protein TNCV_4820571 [Trichonephila clavipes]
MILTFVPFTSIGITAIKKSKVDILCDNIPSAIWPVPHAPIIPVLLPPTELPIISSEFPNSDPLEVQSYDTEYKPSSLRVSALVWIADFLHHTDPLELNLTRAFSDYFKLGEAVPQGPVLSAILFPLFLAGVDERKLTVIDIAIFADDIVLWNSSTDPLIGLAQPNGSSRKLLIALSHACLQFSHLSSAVGIEPVILSL